MDENRDSGWIKGLPADWVDAFICARRLFARFKTELAEADPAPWQSVVNADYWGPHFGKTPEEHALNEKRSARLVAVIQKAVCSGQLSPSWFDGSVFRSVPPYAFRNWHVVRNALLYGQFEVDPLWPDEWQHWTNQGWAIPKDQFEKWMQTDHPLSGVGLPVAESEMPPCPIVSIISRTPSDASRIPLSEAITWIAFGLALDAERLERAIRWESLAGGDLQAAQQLIEAAATTLLKAGADGFVPMYGRHIEMHGQSGQRTKKIDPLDLEDYRQILIINRDELHYGDGLKLWQRTPIESILQGSMRSDYFSGVTVEREALFKRCGSRLASDERRMVIAALPNIGIDRAPSFKSGRAPEDAEILAKADQMKARGLDGRTIAKEMRFEPGFEHVATTAVRELIKGRWKPAGRPKKGA
jgi:hypothetical protein